jgi:hypothetical protein
LLPARRILAKVKEESRGMDTLLWATLGAALWSTSLIAVLGMFVAARRYDDSSNRDLAEAVRVRDLGLPSLPPLVSRSMGRETVQAHPGPDSA